MAVGQLLADRAVRDQLGQQSWPFPAEQIGAGQALVLDYLLLSARRPS